jgi:hypothetical protein
LRSAGVQLLKAAAAALVFLHPVRAHSSQSKAPSEASTTPHPGSEPADPARRLPKGKAPRSLSKPFKSEDPGNAVIWQIRHHVIAMPAEQILVKFSMLSSS